MSNDRHSSTGLNLSNSTSVMKRIANTPDISVDTTWIDALKGIAIIGVFLDNWIGYMIFETTPVLLYSLARSVPVGPFVQVFFILSGFGLTIGHLKQSKMGWSWKKWAWRRITKIVMPYMIFVLASFLLGMLGSHLYTSVDMEFSWGSLLAYLTFTRNSYSPSWGWNIPLWFMPVIIGLYASFPFLLKVLKRRGPWILLLISAFVTYGTLTVAFLVRGPTSHQSDLFTFWMLQFALGIVLGYVRETNAQKLRLLIGPVAFFLGIGLMACSWALRTYVPLGRSFNDPVTSVGIFLVLLNLVWIARAKIPAVGGMLNALSSKSYLMYLIHYPIMKFLIGPPLRVPTNPIIVFLLGGVYVALIFFLCFFISKPIGRLSSWAYHRGHK
jgi:peptidoglycan/LPS O-acetylase OafA/YrhL